MLLVLATLLGLVWTRGGAAPVPPWGRGILPQAHSYDDMREWPQMFRKNITMWKIDPHYEPASFCRTQERVNKTDPRGCFLLNHDDPGGRLTYNSTDDILALLQDQEYLNTYIQPGMTKYLALCFKNAPEDRCTSEDWLSLMDEFFEKATSLIRANGINLELVLDGDAAPTVPCLFQRWTEWSSTYITGSDPLWAFWSNNASLAYDRFQVLDEEVVSWPLAVLLDYGKFVNSTFPFFVWEPSDQATIEFVSDLYLERGTEHPPGLRFAINIDPAQFTVYSASRSGNGWNSQISPSAAFRGGRGALLQQLDGEGGEWWTTVLEQHSGGVRGSGIGQDDTLYVTLQRPSELGGQGQHSIIPLARSLQLPTGDNWSGDLLGFHTLAANASVACGVSAGGDAPFEVVCLVAEKSPEVVSYNRIPRPSHWGEGGEEEASVISATGMVKDAELFVARLANNASCAVAAAVFNVQSGDLKHEFCLVGSGSFVSLGARAVTSKNTTLGAVALGDRNNTIWLLTWCQDTNLVFFPTRMSDCSNAGLRPTLLPPPARWSVGVLPSVDLGVGGDGAISLALASGDSFCWNSETHNKQPVPALCDLIPASTPLVLSYSLGDFWQFGLELREGRTASACDDMILHGSFGQGLNPSITLVDDGWVAVVRGATLSTDPGGCGPPTNTTGVWVDGWAMRAPAGDGIERD